MFNLLMSGNDEAWTDGQHTFERGRYLEHTDDDLQIRFEDIHRSLSDLKTIPSLFTFENGIQRPSRVGKITGVRETQQAITLKYEFLSGVPEIPCDAMAALRPQLEISRFEINRTHWAIKSVDLFDRLIVAGIITPEAAQKFGPPLRYPEISRSVIVAASGYITKLSHTGLDRILLEWGIDGLDAGRNLNGMMARANAVAKYAVAHPHKRTSDGLALDQAILALAWDIESSDADLSSIGEKDRDVVRRGAQEAGMVIQSVEEESAPASEYLPEPLPNKPPVLTAYPPARKVTSTNTDHLPKHKVFLVHGRNNAAKDQVARFIERIGAEVVILHERPNKGRTLISKFQEEADDIGFAVVLMTGDDIGALHGAELAPRARQNVVFELGFFIGKLGASKVCALVGADVERPSDFEAVVYVPYGETTNWRNELARELLDAGIPIDAAKALT